MWEGPFERLIGAFKSAFYKAVGNGTLSWNELSELVLGVEVIINGRPLSYLEEDVEMPVLTPSAMLNLRPNQLPRVGFSSDPGNGPAIKSQVPPSR